MIGFRVFPPLLNARLRGTMCRTRATARRPATNNVLFTKKAKKKHTSGFWDDAAEPASEPLEALEALEDRISSLPDALLHRILSFLPMNCVMDATLLSTRWRDLWKFVPCLNFISGKLRIDQINEALMFYRGEKIQKFSADFKGLQLDERCVNFWIKCLTFRHVEEVHLEFPYYIHGTGRNFQMPRRLLNCKTLEVLSVDNCTLNLPPDYRFPALKELHLYRVQKLTDLDTSGCPLLECLIVRELINSHWVNIHAPNPGLRYMEIHDLPSMSGDHMSISAPYLLSIKVSGHLRSSYDIQNLSSISSATLDFTNMLANEVDDDEYSYDLDDEMDAGDENVHNDEDMARKLRRAATLNKLLQTLAHAKTLKLCQYCIEILSLGEACNLDLPIFTTTTLEVQTNMNEQDLPGLTCVLMNSISLKELIIKNCSKKQTPVSIGYDFNEARCWKLLQLAVSSRPHLRCVKINNSRISDNAQTHDLGKCLENRIKETKVENGLNPQWNVGAASGIHLFKTIVFNRPDLRMTRIILDRGNK